MGCDISITRKRSPTRRRIPARNGWRIVQRLGRGHPIFPQTEGMATRVASGKVLSAISPKLLSLIGGSADLDPSTHTALKALGDSRTRTTRPAICRARQAAVGVMQDATCTLAFASTRWDP